MNEQETSVTTLAGPSTSTVLKDSQIKAKELAASKERNVANMTAAAVALTVGLIVLVALTVFGVIVWAQRRGMFQHTAGVRCQSGCVGMVLVE
jgi:Na+/pantothenate symporter